MEDARFHLLTRVMWREILKLYLFLMKKHLPPFHLVPWKIMLCLIALLGLKTWSDAQNATFSGVGDLPGGDFVSTADGISPDGLYITGTSISANGVEAYLLGPGANMVPLGDLSGGSFESYGEDVINGGAMVLGQSFSGTCFEPFRWNNGTMTGLGDVPNGSCNMNPNMDFTIGMGVSDDGKVIAGTIGAANGDHAAFRWTSNGGMQQIAPIPSKAVGVTPDGNYVICQVKAPSETAATIFDDNSGHQTLPSLGGVLAISVPCDVIGPMAVGGSSSPNSGVNGMEAVAWPLQNFTPTTAIPLGDLPGGTFNSIAGGVSASGVIVGESSTGVVRSSSIFGYDTEAFIYNYKGDSTMRNLRDFLQTEFGLNLQGWTLTKAIEITDDGAAIVGWGVNPQGKDEGWIARIPITGQTNVTSQISPFDLQVYQDEELHTATLSIQAHRPHIPIEVSVWDINGRKIDTAFEGTVHAGSTEIKWENQGAEGIYLLQVRSSDKVATKRLLFR